MSNWKGKMRFLNSRRANKSVGMTTEELRSRKKSQEGFRRPVKDLRFNIKKFNDGISGSSKVLDARSKLQAKRSVEKLGKQPNINLDEQRKQQKSTGQAGNRSLTLDSGTIKITAKQNVPPNRCAEMAGKSIVITTKVETKDKSKSKNHGKPKGRKLNLMGAGGFTVTAKATSGSPLKRKKLDADLVNEEKSNADVDLDYYEYKKLKESKVEEEHLSLPFRRNTTPLAERLDHGPISDNRSTPLTSTKVSITNLQTTVSRQDIEELFGAVGVLKSCKMVGPGAADVVYTKKEDAVTAYARYHNRNLDGQPMQCKLSVIKTTATETPHPSRPLAPLRSTEPSQKLFYPAIESYQPPKRSATSMQSESRPVVFKVKI